MARVTLPPGCTGLDGSSGAKTPSVRQGSSIEVSEASARAIRRGYYGQAGIIGATSYAFGTKTGRRCEPCNRTWNAWSTVCPRCHLPTVEETS